MRTDVKAFLFSLLLHLAIVGGAVSFAGVRQPQVEPVLIDFTIDNTRLAEEDVKRSDPGAAQPAPRRASAPEKRTPKAQPVSPVPPSPSAPVSPAAPREESPVAAPVAAQMVAPAATTAVHTAKAVTGGTVSTSGATGSGGTGNGTGIAKGSGAGSSGSAPKGESTETLRTRYLKAHFAYIRDLIAGNARYPGLARRMGWSGQVFIEFVILKDGSVDKIRIVKSSGVPLLDSDARDSVLRSALFPKPPVSAKLVIPVEYKLEN